MPGRIRTGFLGSRNCFFCRLFNLHILQLAITLEDMEDFRVRKHLEYGFLFFSTISSLRISEFLSFFATHRTSVLPMLEASTFFSCIASSLCHQKQQIPLEGDCVSLGLSSYSGGSLLGKELSCICFFFLGCDLFRCWKFKAALTLLHFVGAGHVRI